MLGAEYLEQLLMTDSGPVHFLDDEANPLRKWLLSAMVDSHIIQAMELAGYFKEFQSRRLIARQGPEAQTRQFLADVFELALATRIKRSEPRYSKC